MCETREDRMRPRHIIHAWEMERNGSCRRWKLYFPVVAICLLSGEEFGSF